MRFYRENAKNLKALFDEFDAEGEDGKASTRRVLDRYKERKEAEFDELHKVFTFIPLCADLY